jgi:Anti-sigma-K factor rskA, C-terminal
MDHDEVREQLELAATEPAGIDRLMAGDTPLAAAIAAHLAGCSSCTDELDRLRRAAIIIGDAVRTTPPPELRERTLAFVRDVGRIREAPAPVASITATLPVAVSAATAPAGFGRGLAWVGAIAAAVLIAVTATAFVLDRQAGDRLAVAQAQSAGLAHVTAATLALTGEPDAEHVQLAGTEDRWGRVVYSADKGELAVIANGLTEPAGDREYRCWVEIDGQRTPVGKMFFGGDLAFWAGPVETISDLPPGSTFGVSLVDTAGSDVGEPPVLTGNVAE